MHPHTGYQSEYTCNKSGGADLVFPPFKIQRSDRKSRIMLKFRLEKREEIIGVLSGQISLSPGLWNQYQPIDFLNGTDPVEFFKGAKGLGSPSSPLRLSLIFDELPEVFYLKLKESEGSLTKFCIKILKDAESENKKIEIE